jgi:hypothetical protein
MILTLFNYPTPQLAMQKAGDFQKLPGAVVKRSGPLVAVILSPNDPDLAEHVLAEVRYQAEITRNEYVPTRRDNVGYLLTDIFVFTGLLLGFCFVAGIFMGGGRVLLRYIRKGEEPPAMITLSIDRHS